MRGRRVPTGRLSPPRRGCQAGLFPDPGRAAAAGRGRPGSGSRFRRAFRRRPVNGAIAEGVAGTGLGQEGIGPGVGSRGRNAGPGVLGAGPGGASASPCLGPSALASPLCASATAGVNVFRGSGPASRARLSRASSAGWRPAVPVPRPGVSTRPHPAAGAAPFRIRSDRPKGRSIPEPMSRPRHGGSGRPVVRSGGPGIRRRFLPRKKPGTLPAEVSPNIRLPGNAGARKLKRARPPPRRPLSRAGRFPIIGA